MLVAAIADSNHATEAQTSFVTEVCTFTWIPVLRILDPVPFYALDRGCVKSQDPDEQPRSYFRELRNHFFWLKYLNSLMRILGPGWKKIGSGIQEGKNSYPG
jgi:hypothetical protein